MIQAKHTTCYFLLSLCFHAKNLRDSLEGQSVEWTGRYLFKILTQISYKEKEEIGSMQLKHANSWPNFDINTSRHNLFSA